MSKGTGVTYTARSTPKVFDYLTCGEASSDLVWSGAPYDEVARQYVAEEMHVEPTVSSSAIGARDVFAVSAMEGIGWMSALAYHQRYFHCQVCVCLYVKMMKRVCVCVCVCACIFLQCQVFIYAMWFIGNRHALFT
jgi:hypothetical protein